MVRQLPLLALLVVSLVLPQHIQAATGPPARVDVVVHGLKLSLLVPRTSYPENALVRVTVSVQNISHHGLRAFNFFGDCSSSVGTHGGIYGYGPVQVLNAAAQILYPPALRPGFSPICVLVDVALRPGRVITEQVFAIVRGDRLRARAQVFVRSNPTSHEIVTPPLSLELVPGTAPQVELHASGGDVSADVHPAGPVHGPLHYLTWVRCAAGSTQRPGVPNTLLWETTTSTHLVPPCSPVTEWHLVAGWLNQPVAQFDYIEGQPPPPGVLLQPHGRRA